jgi:tRNA pseudouridine38-40 synthase
MFDEKYYYVIHIQYLGYRFHGWQKQPNLKTVHLMIDRTLKYILEGEYFKTIGSGRTDAMVSADNTAFELFLRHKIDDEIEFLNLLNYNLPQDLRALSIKEVGKNFNIIHDSVEKEYWYLFSYGQKCHPFCAPIMTTILDKLDIDLMIKGAVLFKGNHNFKSYCYKPSENGVFKRFLSFSLIEENTDYTANFFPEKSYIFKVKGKGFGRNQIRLMMGMLIKLGKREVELSDISRSLEEKSNYHVDYIAPASGLILKNNIFNY